MPRSLFVILILLSMFLSMTKLQETSFVHLIGYSIVSDIIETFEGVNINECAEACINSAFNCIGFELIQTQCQTLTWIRNILEEATTCSFYVLDTRNSSSDLSEINQLIFYNAYGDNSCPQEADDNDYFCSVSSTPQKCNEYADIFDAYMNGTKCILLPSRTAYYCDPTTPRTQHSSYSITGLTYCYFNLTVAQNQSIDYYTNQCQTASPASNIIFICSEEENNFVVANGFIAPRLMIGLYLPDGVTWAPEAFVWSDGGTCSYRNWLANEPNNQYSREKLIRLEPAGQWADVYAWLYDYAFCKETALTLKEYYDVCKGRNDCL